MVPQELGAVGLMRWPNAACLLTAVWQAVEDGKARRRQPDVKLPASSG